MITLTDSYQKHRQRSKTHLKEVCQEILQIMISFQSWSAEIRSKAIKNRTRCLLLAETQKVAEKYNSIGNKYLMPLFLS